MRSGRARAKSVERDATRLDRTCPLRDFALNKVLVLLRRSALRGNDREADFVGTLLDRWRVQRRDRRFIELMHN